MLSKLGKYLFVLVLYMLFAFTISGAVVCFLSLNVLVGTFYALVAITAFYMATHTIIQEVEEWDSGFQRSLSGDQ